MSEKLKIEDLRIGQELWHVGRRTMVRVEALTIDEKTSVLVRILSYFHDPMTRSKEDISSLRLMPDLYAQVLKDMNKELEQVYLALANGTPYEPRRLARIVEAPAPDARPMGVPEGWRECIGREITIGAKVFCAKAPHRGQTGTVREFKSNYGLISAVVDWSNGVPGEINSRWLTVIEPVVKPVKPPANPVSTTASDGLTGHSGEWKDAEDQQLIDKDMVRYDGKLGRLSDNSGSLFVYFTDGTWRALTREDLANVVRQVWVPNPDVGEGAGP